MGFTIINDDDLQDVYRSKSKRPTKLPKSRVSDLYLQFEKLTQVEKINFINMIKNYG
jgi:hypothetical protein